MEKIKVILYFIFVIIFQSCVFTETVSNEKSILLKVPNSTELEIIEGEIKAASIELNPEQQVALDSFLDKMKLSIMAEDETAVPEERIGFLKKVFDLNSPFGLSDYQNSLSRMASGQEGSNTVFLKEFGRSFLV